MNSKISVFPVRITKGEHKALQVARSSDRYNAKTASQLGEALQKLVRMMLDGGMVLEYGADAMDATTSGTLLQS
jgi:hypothetical protein